MLYQYIQYEVGYIYEHWKRESFMNSYLLTSVKYNGIISFINKEQKYVAFGIGVNKILI